MGGSCGIGLVTLLIANNLFNNILISIFHPPTLFTPPPLYPSTPLSLHPFPPPPFHSFTFPLLHSSTSPIFSLSPPFHPLHLPHLSQLFKGTFYHCDGSDVEDVVNKTDCMNKGKDYKWVNRKYNFDSLGQVGYTGNG